ncbi:fanconi anemia group J protein [Nematocida major]|uniref:fanconi anemia group J protein n=1 Tax=Nematocida major TaxID=1912982 RepID=UPI002007714E|nr:fanconi anemia group J protein [Nematocida major]KAH9386794.1 fanconi anemia group J protein [Nematocida major]
MHNTSIKGYDISTPHELYKAQTQCIETILTCLENSESGMIESPTGTGKTLSILASVNAWLNSSNKPEGQKVYITTRTVKQADQLITHMKRMQNPPTMALLASRKHMCLNPEVKQLKSTDIDTECKRRVKDGKNTGTGCSYYFKNPEEREEKIRKMSREMSNPYSIEDLVRTGEGCKTCPYYYIQDKQKNATVIFAPYNYIINSRIRKAMSIELVDSAIIVDEAHNIDDACRSTGSVDVRRDKIESILSTLNAVLKASNVDSEEKELVRWLIIFLSKIQAYILEKIPEILKSLPADCIVENMDGEKEGSIPQERFMQEMEAFGMTAENLDSLNNCVGSLVEELELDTYTKQWLEQMVQVFRMIIEKGKKNYCMLVSKGKISFILLRAAIIFDEIYRKSRCVVLLSGTLQPFRELTTELSTEKNAFNHFLVTDHIIKASQLYTATISTYKKASTMGVFKNTRDRLYLDAVSSAIIDITQSLDGIGGVLCFVPSYVLLNSLKSLVEKHVMLITESKLNSEFECDLERYRNICRRGKCVFLCVFRGKASEGIDFRDHESRAVVLVGIPYPSIRNHAIIEKKKYNDTYMQRTGALWYEQQAFRAVKQALGRCIRHKGDWGSIFLLDSRYERASMLSKLPKWAINGHMALESKERLVEKYRPFLEQQDKSTTERPPGPSTSAYLQKRKYMHAGSSNKKWA